MIGSKLAPCLWAKMPLRWIKEIKRTRHGKAWKNLFARLQCNLICLLSDAFHMMLFLAKKLYSNIFKLYIRKSRCLLSLEMSVPWGIIHGNMAVGSLWSRECTASFVGIFVFIDHCTMIYHSLTLGAALPEEKKTPTQLSQTRPCCAEKVFRSAIWKTSSWTAENSFQPRKSPPNPEVPTSAFSRFSQSAPQRCVCWPFFHLKSSLSQRFSQGVGNHYLSKAPVTLLWEPAKLPSWLLHEKWKRDSLVIRFLNLHLYRTWLVLDMGFYLFNSNLKKRKHMKFGIPTGAGRGTGAGTAWGVWPRCFWIFNDDFVVFGKTKVTTWGQTLLEFLTNLKVGKIFNQQKQIL